MPQPRNIQQLLTAYREYLLSRISKVRILGESNEIDLKEVFVNLSIVDQQARSLEVESLGMLDMAVRQRISPYAKRDRVGSLQNTVPRKGARCLMESHDLLMTGTRAIVTGAPGCGKTTLLKYLALRVLEHEERLAVWLELKAIAKPLFNIAEKAAARDGSLILVHLWLRHLKAQMLLSDMELKLLRQHWEEKFRVNQVAVLLDGFDELQDDTLEYGLNKCIGEYTSPIHSNTLIISTRPYAQHKLGHEHLRELEIEPLSQHQVEAFLKCYYPNEIATRTLLRKMRQQSSFRDLVQIPLLLGVILRLHREGRLTDNRLEIYLTVINDLVHKLDRSKSVTRQFKIKNERLRLEFLQFLAFERLLIDTVSEGEPDLNRLVFSYAVLKEKAKKFLSQERDSYSPRDLADDALATPLLREVKIDNFAFAHLSLQEFLAARALAFLHKQNPFQSVKLFCRAYHNPMLVEMEVLPMMLGALSDADPLYAEIEGWPESVTLASLRLRARGLAYSARVSHTRLSQLVDRWLTLLSRRNPDGEPYDEMVTNSFLRMQNDARDLVEAKIPSLLNVGDPDFFVRTKQLMRWRSKKALEALVSALSNKDVRIRKEAIRVLGETASEEAIMPLTISAKSDPSTDVRKAAIRALGGFEDRRATEAILAHLKDIDVSVRNSAASELSHRVSPHGSEQVIDALIQALKDPSEYVRASAALSLKQSGSVRARDVIITIATTDLVPYVRSKAIIALSEWKDDRATRAMFQGLKDKDWVVRYEAASVLWSIGSEAAADALIVALKDENHFVRMKAAQSLAHFFSPRVIDELKSALKDENRGVCNFAAKSLDKIMSVDDSDLSIYEKLKKSEPDLVLPLKRVPNKTEKPRFSDLRLLKEQPFLSREHFTRFITVKDLWRMNSKELVLKLTLTIEKSDAFARKKAIESLGYYSSSVKSLDLLERTAQTDKDADIRKAAKDAAQKLTRKFELLDHVINNDMTRPLRETDSSSMTGQPLTAQESSQAEKMGLDFLIVTALEKERLPLSKVFKAKAIPKNHDDAVRYESAEVFLSPTESYHVKLICVGDQGPSYTAAVLSGVLARLSPRYVIMAGIAAVLPGEGRKFKDVLLATHIVDLTDQKQWPKEIEIRKRTFKCERELVQEADRFYRQSRKWSANVRLGAIISQTDLVKSAKHRDKMVRLVSETEPGLKVVGLEREGAGIGIAVDITTAGKKPGILMVKAAVDFANYHKNDTVQQGAAKRAADFVHEFLRSRPVGVRPSIHSK